jgi:hypothetical protein
MAAISFTAQKGRYQVLRSAQTTTLTDWILTPSWATSVIIHLDISAAGTNTILTAFAGRPFNLDDARTALILTSATITAAGYHTYTIAPNATTVADSATVGTAAVVPGAVPSILGITTTPTGSTYSVAVEFRG